MLSLQLACLFVLALEQLLEKLTTLNSYQLTSLKTFAITAKGSHLQLSPLPHHSLVLSAY